MGLFGALFAGVSGLDSQSNKIGIISNNVSNVNTVGYKQSAADFDTLVVPSGTTSFSPGGVIGNTLSLVNQQGLLEATSSATDAAVTGNGFFVVNTQADGSGTQLLTRSGSFTQDSNGNFVNSDGYYLQGVSLAGLTTALTSVNQGQLTTVNINQNATGSANATTTLTVAANFNADQKALLGSGEKFTLANDATNSQNTASQIVVPTSGTNSNGLVRGDAFSVNSTKANTTNVFTYGGFVQGRNVGDSTSVGDNGNLLVNDSLSTNPITTYAVGTAATKTYSAINNIVVGGTGGAFSPVGANEPFAANSTLQIGSYAGVTLTAGETLTQIAAALQGTMPIGSTVTITGSAGNYGLAVSDSSAAGAGFNTTASSAIANNTNPSFAVVSPTNVPSNTQFALTLNATSGTAYNIGQKIYVSGVTSTVNGVPASDINGERTIVGINGNTLILSTGGGAGATSGGASTGVPSGITVTNRTYAFTGNVLNATAAGNDLMTGLTAATTFTTAALSFNIATYGSGGTSTTTTLTYNSQPNPQNGQFNSLNSLATAINDSSNGALTASVQNGQIYISSVNANQGFNITNGDASGNGTLSGINWTQELGLPSTAVPNENAPAASGTTRFNTLAGLANAINTPPISNNLIATVSNATNAGSTLSINEADPTSAITFTDGNTSGATPTVNTGSSLLTAFGLLNTSGGKTLTPVTGQTNENTIALPLTYSPTSTNSDMSSGTVKAQFTKDITIYDALGNAHTVAMNVSKLGVNQWAVELTSVPASDVVSAVTNAAGVGDGQIAAGVVTFNNDGTVQSNTLGASVIVNWTQTGPNAVGAAANTISLDLTGLTQSAGSFNVTSANQNGSPTGQLTGVTINNQGFIVETFSNGQTKEAYQVPLANVNNPNGLQSITGDAYQATLSSGTVSYNIPGQGGTGTITPSALEQSNVDLSTQLTDLIVAQQAYGANSKLLTVADTLLQELDQIIQ